MTTRFYILMKLFSILALSVFLVSCNEAIPKRSTISPNQLVDDEPETCPKGFHEEKVTDEKTKEESIDCVADPLVRPTNAIAFKADFCGCKTGKALTYGNCGAFCAGKANTQETELLFANFTVTSDLAVTGLGSVHGWCTAQLPGEKVNPKCELEAKTEDGSVQMLDVTALAGTNSITANISSMGQDKTYVLTLVETISKARSNSIQIIKFSSDISIPVIGPLKNAPISQYSCIVRDAQTDQTTGDIYFDSMYRMHFYFLPRIPPTPIPAGMSNLICHDIFNPLMGIVDDELFPRLELTPGAFNLWDNTDPRFYDNNGNTIMDVNDIIIQKTKTFGGSLPARVNFFSPFIWPGEPQLQAASGNGANTTQPIGFFMAPWIDSQSFKSYCLNSTHYNSNNSLYKALRDIVGVDTEGLYIGEKAAEAVTNPDGSTNPGFKDYILIRETDLKKAWFHLNNGVPTVPTEDNVANVAVYFYHPVNFASPFVKTSTQRIYRVRGANELNNTVSRDTTAPSGATSSFPPHDRKIGCIPKF
ncbi:MAG TPA: hypothetical protein VNJ08_06025 [Bacteriovoracaceae bacterium]|nr:hypothetical protein [Bacteriovoracaceae bacterium]